jgi:sulfur carrier protein
MNVSSSHPERLTDLGPVMKIKVNSNHFELEKSNQLGALITQLSLEGKGGIAIAVNAEVVHKKEWNNFLLNENDDVVIIEAAQGG